MISKKIKKNKIIFTGSTGSIGSFMPKNQNIIATNFRIEDTQIEIEKELRESGATTLIHLAAMVNVKNCENNVKKCNQINVNGSVKIFKAASNVGFKKFIFVSTGQVYGVTKKIEKIKINKHKNPMTVYSKSKSKAENKLIILAKSKKKIKLSIARVFSVLSNKMEKGFVYTTLNEIAKKDEDIPIYGLNNVRDFLYADQVCKKLIKLAYSKKFPSKVNICSGKPKSIKQLAKSVFKSYGLSNKKIIESKEKYITNFLVGVPSKF